MAIDRITASGLGDGSVSTADLADGAVTTAKIGSAEVTLAKLASDVSFDASKIDSGTTAARVAAPDAGTLYYNTDTDSVQVYNTGWTDIFNVPTLSASSGTILVGQASDITLTVSTDDTTIDVEFRNGSSLLATVTNVTVNSGSATVSVPSSVYNGISGGNTITVRAKGKKGTRSSASESFTAQQLATGGTLTTDSTHAYHAFLTSNNFVVPSGLTITNGEVLIVAGGGSGGTGTNGLGANNNGAGGGGGGIQHLTSQTISVGTYAIEVGQGGSGVAPQNTAGNNGTQSSAFSTVAGAGNKNAGLTGGASGTPQSNSGGGAGSYAGGGGGGAGGAGSGGGANSKKAGGAGALYSNFTAYGAEAQTTVTLTPTANGYFAGGGQGAGAAGSGIRASGGGGAAGTDNQSGTTGKHAGVANTGGGGSGGYAQTEYSGNGGSGIVIIRYPLPS